MKRTLFSLATATLLGFAAFAYADSTLVVKPSDMKDGETKTVTDDGRTITVTREGNTTHVKIDDSGKVDRLTITREGNRLRIGHLDDNGTKSFVIGPDRKKIIIDGVPLDQFMDPDTIIRPRRNLQTWFVCPKDHTTLRVPEGKEDQTYKCPVDGTTMEKKKGHGFQFFFDDFNFETHEL